ncbi:PspC domain-containing protein [Enterococcus hermanniensis]|uniref:Phage shock protein PspC N-terminal domain-containing protein n=1 Tax=Enterococcus hermanniensis TaxID=249189 RepID=A0A1L8TQ84_9ENTE|nr:PspC domain-containing protein [Enterococcus hermanniensis]OJG46292.1 hypothetical protein RV04_GL001458 [Enterococcus hermanniensis]
MNKKLTKSSTNKVLTGTLAGLAEYFGIDPTIVRVAFVVAIFIFEGTPILLYLLFAMLMPKKNRSRKNFDKDSFQQTSQSTKKESDSEDKWSDF